MTNHLTAVLDLTTKELVDLYNKGTEDWAYHEKYRDGWSPDQGYEAVLEYREDCGYCVVVYYYDGVSERWGNYTPLSEL